MDLFFFPSCEHLWLQAVNLLPSPVGRIILVQQTGHSNNEQNSSLFRLLILIFPILFIGIIRCPPYIRLVSLYTFLQI